MNVPNVAPNMPHVLPGMPDAAPGAPQTTSAQQAGQVPLGCAGCGTGSTGAKFPMWAKVMIPVGLLGITITIVALAASNRRRVAPYVEAFEETDF